MTRFVTLLLALQLLNLSIYVQDFKPLYVQGEPQEININETIVEYVVEVVLQHKNAIPEQQPEHKDLHLHKHGALYKVFSTDHSLIADPVTATASCLCIPHEEFFIDRYQREIRPQPPQAV